MGFLDTLLGSKKEKTSQPFNQQLAGGLLLSLFSGAGAQGFASLKPQLFQQLFGDPGQKLSKNKGRVAGDLFGLGPEATQGPGGLTSDIGRFRRYTEDYRPFDYLKENPFGRPGGPSSQEQDILGRSLGGLSAPLDLRQSNAAQQDLDRFLKSLTTPATGQTGVLPAGLQGFVDKATSGVQTAFKEGLEREATQLQSRYASEGSYLSGPALNAEAQLRGTATSQFAGALGQLQLEAALQGTESLMRGYGLNFGEAFTLASAQQASEQDFLDRLLSQYDRPGGNLLEVLLPFLSQSPVSKSKTQGSLLEGLGKLLGGAGGFLEGFK